MFVINYLYCFSAVEKTLGSDCKKVMFCSLFDIYNNQINMKSFVKISKLGLLSKNFMEASVKQTIMICCVIIQGANLRISPHKESINEKNIRRNCDIINISVRIW